MELLKKRGRVLAAAAVALATFGIPAAANAAAPKLERIPGFKSPGTPAKYNRVGILEFGSTKAKNILVLNPGTSASAAYFAPLAETIVKANKNWQVWAVERRENLLEDHSLADKVKAGDATPKEMFDYYLGWTGDSSITDRFQLIPDAEIAYAREWGMRTELEDLRRVVLRAKRGGRTVVVGGHSLGGSMTAAYATWDFDGKVGADGLAGLVFIDGGSSRTPVTPTAAQESLTRLENGSPWLNFGGIAAPFAGLFNIVAATLVKTEPNAPALLDSLAALPDNLRPPVAATNVGGYGFALDTETSPPALAAAQAHLGHLATSGDPRGWDQAGELTPIQRYATAFAGWRLKGLDGTAWYHPLKLTIDSGAVAAGNDNPAQEVLDLDAIHGDDLPKTMRIYAFGTSLGGKRVLDAAKLLAKQSGIPSKQLTLVNREKTYAHNDPNTAYPKNDFVKYLLPYLKKVQK